MYYYPFLDINNFKNLTETVGRCAHEIRNFAAGYSKIEYPEIQIIDNLSGQIEGIMRDIIGYTENMWDIKPLIRNSIRPTMCLSKLINEGISEIIIQNIPIESLKKQRKILVFQSNCLKEMDEMLNKAIIEESKNNFGKFNFEVIDTKQIINEIYKEFNWNGDIKKFKIEAEVQLNLQKFNELNIFISKYMCNYAHEIQNLCAFYIHKAPENTFINKIINIAGQIEDNSRKIQDIINNHNPKPVPNRSQYTANFYSTIIGVCDKVHDLIKQIEDAVIEEKCPLKITNEDVHRLLSAEENFTDAIKQNMLIGYAF